MSSRKRWPYARSKREWYHDPKRPERATIAHDHDVCEMLDYIDTLTMRNKR